jgi:hypothetical protein
MSNNKVNYVPNRIRLKSPEIKSQANQDIIRMNQNLESIMYLFNEFAERQEDLEKKNKLFRAKERKEGA